MGIWLIETIEARDSKILHSMKSLRYEARLVKWRVDRLEDRRVRAHLIEMYKYVNELDEINLERYPVINTPRDRFLTRSNGFEIKI